MSGPCGSILTSPPSPHRNPHRNPNTMQKVALSLCPGEQPRQRRCNTQPCWPTAWYTKPWVEGCVAAEAGCGPGEQNREEFFSKCIDSLNRIGGPHRQEPRPSCHSYQQR